MLNNLGLKLISLFLAFLLWFLVVQIGDPKDDQDMGNVRVKLINTELLDNENKVYEVLDDTDVVRVTVYAPKSVFTQLRSRDIVAEADVSKLTDINTIPIEFSSNPANVVSITGSRDVVKLNIEDKASKYVTLQSHTVGTVSDGYVVMSLTPDQNRIEVSGPKSVVDQVKYAGAEIDVSEATSNLTANVDVHLYDVTGSEVDYTKLSKNVNYVRMTVEVLAMKEVPVQYVVTGEPEEGYMVSGEVTCDPETVQIAGSAYALSNISEITIPEGVVDITGAQESVSKTVNLREYLPENIRLANSSFNGRVSITIPLEAVVERSFQVPVEDISIAHVPEGYTAEISESAETTYTVETAGLQAALDELRQNGLKGVVDLDAWMEKEHMERLRIGSYMVPVTFQTGEDIVVKNSVNVRITIKEAE